jgi:hypothetical protein
MLLLSIVFACLQYHWIGLGQFQWPRQSLRPKSQPSIKNTASLKLDSRLTTVPKRSVFSTSYLWLVALLLQTILLEELTILTGLPQSFHTNALEMVTTAFSQTCMYDLMRHCLSKRKHRGTDAYIKGCQPRTNLVKMRMVI